MSVSSNFVFSRPLLVIFFPEKIKYTADLNNRCLHRLQFPYFEKKFQYIFPDFYISFKKVAQN
jgi:hypothetical protein